MLSSSWGSERDRLYVGFILLFTECFLLQNTVGVLFFDGVIVVGVVPVWKKTDNVCISHSSFVPPVPPIIVMPDAVSTIPKAGTPCTNTLTHCGWLPVSDIRTVNTSLSLVSEEYNSTNGLCTLWLEEFPDWAGFSASPTTLFAKVCFFWVLFVFPWFFSFLAFLSFLHFF